MFYYFTVLMFWQNITDPANRQIWFVIQFTTSRLDDGDLKRLCHGRTKRFVPAPVFHGYSCTYYAYDSVAYLSTAPRARARSIGRAERVRQIATLREPRAARRRARRALRAAVTTW